MIKYLLYHVPFLEGELVNVQLSQHLLYHVPFLEGELVNVQLSQHLLYYVPFLEAELVNVQLSVWYGKMSVRFLNVGGLCGTEMGDHFSYCCCVSDFFFVIQGNSDWSSRNQTQVCCSQDVPLTTRPTRQSFLIGTVYCLHKEE